jgi:CRP-like cAMP-binding protein
VSADRSSNRMLSALSDGEWLPWSDQLHPIELPAGHELQAPGVAPSHVYFPTSALIALMQPTKEADEVCVALVGNDGALGVAALLGTSAESSRAVVLHPGVVWRLPVSALTVDSPDPVRTTRVVLGYLQSLTAQMSQTALCQRVHTVEQRLGRWVLMAFDRLPGDALAMDLGDLAVPLKAPAEALAGAAAQLVASGALAFEPGRLRLLDRQVLKAHACDCAFRVQLPTG